MALKYCSLADMAFEQAMAAVFNTAGGTLDRDTIHTSSFTEDLIGYCQHTTLKGSRRI